MVTRIATYFQNQNSLRGLQTANEGLALTSYQVTSGYKGRTLADTAADSNQILNLRDVLARADVYQANITTASNRLKSAENALAGMTDLLAEAASVATLGRNENSASTRASLAPKAQAIADTFYNLFKTKFEGKYIFSGSDGDDEPVSGTATATTFPGLPLTTTWYNGDTTPPSVITGPGSTLQYGATGDEDAFAGMKAGLEALWYGLENNSLADIDNAISTLQTVRKDLSVLQGRVGGQINTLDQLGTRLDNQKTFSQEQLDGLEKVDVSEALTKFSQQQATLESSMLIITRINQLSLLDFLR
ncbi:MAG: flagellin [Alphaproteobacteria bacterium]